MMGIGKWLSQSLYGLAAVLAVGALVCGPVGQARANFEELEPEVDAIRICTCSVDTCTANPRGPCCNGFCNCTDAACGCRADPRSPTTASCK